GARGKPENRERQVRRRLDRLDDSRARLAVPDRPEEGIAGRCQNRQRVEERDGDVRGLLELLHARVSRAILGAPAFHTALIAVPGSIAADAPALAPARYVRGNGRATGNRGGVPPRSGSGGGRLRRGAAVFQHGFEA